jgi:DNA-binding GntR family transcriptional regulator
MPSATEQTWPLSRRYARARDNQGLVFSADVAGIRKATISREWITPSPAIAQLLRVDPGAQVFRRVSRTYLGDQPVEDTAMHFPAAVIADAPALETDDTIQVVRLIEATGRRITRTDNQVRARPATDEERALLQLPDAAGIVLELIHGTYGPDDEPLEAVINVKPATGVVLTFQTDEG